MKRYIYAFPKPKWIETVSCDGKPCGGGHSCGSTTTTGGNCQSEACGDSSACTFEGMLTSFEKKYSDDVEVKIADYSSLNSIQGSLLDLNRILMINGESLRLTLDNIDLVFSQIAPIVAIDNILAFVKKTPNEDDLVAALELNRSKLSPDSHTVRSNCCG